MRVGTIVHYNVVMTEYSWANIARWFIVSISQRHWNQNDLCIWTVYDVVYGVTGILDHPNKGLDITFSLLSRLVQETWCKLHHLVMVESKIAAMAARRCLEMAPFIGPNTWMKKLTFFISWTNLDKTWLDLTIRIKWKLYVISFKVLPTCRIQSYPHLRFSSSYITLCTSEELIVRLDHDQIEMVICLKFYICQSWKNCGCCTFSPCWKYRCQCWK